MLNYWFLKVVILEYNKAGKRFVYKIPQTDKMMHTLTKDDMCLPYH